MRKNSRLLAVSPFLLLFATGCAALSSHPHAYGQAIQYRSGKPLYAKIALNADASAILRVAFDESKGTGTGYDLLYADVDSNERSGRLQKLPARTRRSGTRVFCDFPPLKLNVPCNNRSLGTSYPCEITFNYQKYLYQTRTTGRYFRAPSSLSTRTREYFSVSASIELRDGSERWKYSFPGSRGNIKPSQTLGSAPVWKFLQSPKVAITTRPDGRRPGNLGIALNLVTGENRFECKRGTIPVKAQVEITRGDGRVVHRGSGTLDKFTFG